jgi:syntenin-1
MAGLYPCLEDLQIDTVAKAHVNAERVSQAIEQAQQSGAPLTVSLYGDLGLDELLKSYGGLDISALSLQKYTPPGAAGQMRPYATPIAAVTPVEDRNRERAEIRQGVREVTLCKDQNGKVGLSVMSIDKGVFVSFVWRGSAAALAGLRFGDQILQINGEAVAGWSMDKTLTYLKNADASKIKMIIRDRPFDRVITVVKDASNQIGFLFKNGCIEAIVKDSSAARNGLLINHHVVEVNGQNVVAMSDDDMLKTMQACDRAVTITVLPKFIYEHLTKHMSVSEMRKNMDRSVADM